MSKKVIFKKKKKKQQHNLSPQIKSNVMDFGRLHTYIYIPIGFFRIFKIILTSIIYTKLKMSTVTPSLMLQF